MDLIKKRCEPCASGTKPFDRKEAEKHLKLLKTKWDFIGDLPSHKASEGQVTFKIRKKYKFGSFKEAITFINRVADLADSEDHHPNIFNSYNSVTITLSTHSIAGLSINDFILAAKIETL